MNSEDKAFLGVILAFCLMIICCSIVDAWQKAVAVEAQARFCPCAADKPKAPQK